MDVCLIMQLRINTSSLYGNMMRGHNFAYPPRSKKVVGHRAEEGRTPGYEQRNQPTKCSLALEAIPGSLLYLRTLRFKRTRTSSHALDVEGRICSFNRRYGILMFLIKEVFPIEKSVFWSDIKVARRIYQGHAMDDAGSAGKGYPKIMCMMCQLGLVLKMVSILELCPIQSYMPIRDVVKSQTNPVTLTMSNLGTGLSSLTSLG